MTSFTLHLMRHGEPVQTGLLLGHTDMPLGEHGHEACLKAASALRFDRIVASDLMRAAETASALAKARNLALRKDERWRELDFGQWDGMSPQSLPSEQLAAFWEDPDGNPPPSGERWSDLVGRTKQALQSLSHMDTLVVTHAGTIRAALAVLCGFDVRQVWAFDLPYACVLTLQIWPSINGQAPSGQILRLAA